jgi:hypothetical protein
MTSQSTDKARYSVEPVLLQYKLPNQNSSLKLHFLQLDIVGTLFIKKNFYSINTDFYFEVKIKNLEIGWKLWCATVLNILFAVVHACVCNPF